MIPSNSFFFFFFLKQKQGLIKGKNLEFEFKSAGLKRFGKKWMS